MDKTERETRDLMSVESFSQLPFIRPSPVKPGRAAIRLFGKEFGGTTATTTDDEPSDPANGQLEESESNKDHNTTSDHNNNNNNNNSSQKVEMLSSNSSNRKFECHYCCRNFPTSQALGGHQNAHKRERQHAKRAHLQSTMVHVSSLDSHNYDLLAGYNRPIGYPHHHHPWNNTTTRQLYGRQFPINGSPLSTWRIPSRDSVLPSWQYNNHHQQRNNNIVNSPSSVAFMSSKPLLSATSGGELTRRGLGFKEGKGSSSMQDNVSLDLHL